MTVEVNIITDLIVTLISVSFAFYMGYMAGKRSVRSGHKRFVMRK